MKTFSLKPMQDDLIPLMDQPVDLLQAFTYIRAQEVASPVCWAWRLPLFLKQKETTGQVTEWTICFFLDY